MFSDNSEYFNETLTFLKEYQWIFNYPNTEILVRNVLDEIPEEWLSYFKDLNFNDLKNIALCNCNENSPDSFKKFIKKIQKLSLPQNEIQSNVIDYNFDKNCGLSVKKRHEIVSLAPVVAEICKISNTNEMIDIGAGLGYLSFLLAEKHNFSVLAIEGCDEKIQLGLKIQEKHHKLSKDKVKFQHHYITNESLLQIKEMIEKNFDNSQNICVCGLHACADLSITILELFLKLKEVKSLIIMPCCYHRLKLEKSLNGKEIFKNFPASKLLKEYFDEFDASNFLRTPFLRLACQQTLTNFINLTEDEHLRHAENFLMRSVLEKAANDVGCSVSRLKRKTGKLQNKSNNFECYLENLSKTHKLIPKQENKEITDKLVNIEDDKFQESMMDIWMKNNKKNLLIELLTTFQTLLQSVCENILLQDRLQFLRENNVNCYIKKVADDNISPRCYALIAIKQ